MAIEVSSSISSEVVQMTAPKPVTEAERRQTLNRVADEARVQAQDESAAVNSEAKTEKSDQQVANEELMAAVSDLNAFVQNVSRSLQFNVDNESGSTVVKVMDAETDELIRQIPSAELLELSRRIEENVGLILKTKA